MLTMNDGFPNQRPGSRSEVKHLQRLLNHTGFTLTADGYFGQATKDAVMRFQQAESYPATGDVDDATWQALEKRLAARLTDAATAPTALPDTELEGFRGDSHWIHQREGHAGKAYWPGGASGVTLDPGFDLGHQETDAIRQHFSAFLSPEQLDACIQCIGITGEEARSRLDESAVLGSIRVSREQAEQVFPAVLAPYWEAISRRFPVLTSASTPPAVQTALLSLAFNRGAYNRDLASLSEPLAEHDWMRVGTRIGQMQQNHSLAGIRKRRKMEGDLILDAAE
ncbi:pesticin C-terminus-like muramidase [Alteromonas sp. CYL-A6]|uniref:pesticin C-terminus-like muramidase n=1 Tax=Alteromonas nitratireducens TaxID=3390813 RepID=UPI0034AF8859